LDNPCFGSRIGRRTQKAQHDPTAGRDLQVEGAVTDERVSAVTTARIASKRTLFQAVELSP